MKFKFNVTGLDCPHCAEKLSAMIGGEAGIDSAKINFLTEKLTVESAMDESEVLDVACRAAKAFSKDVKIAK